MILKGLHDPKTKATESSAAPAAGSDGFTKIRSSSVCVKMSVLEMKAE